jgi:ubiquitin carboxyl-terminal hydrolase 25
MSRETILMVNTGRQHDVSECMDNCMFQIETALLKFDGTDVIDENGDNKSSIVKRYVYLPLLPAVYSTNLSLFYGTIRQRLGVTIDKKGKAVEPKLDLFSHVPINVAEDGFDIYDGLGQYFDDTVEFEGQKVPMQLSLVALPSLLQIQLQASVRCIT